MEKKRIYHIIEWMIALSACAYLVYRLVVFDDYAALWASLRGMGWKQVLALLVCVALMPVNMGIEAWKWCTLMNIPFRDAQRQVYYGKLAGLITPWRAGEYPARAMLMNDEGIWGRVLSMGFVSGATMTTVIIVAGVFSLGILGIIGNLGGLETLRTNTYRYLLVGVLLLLGVALYFAPKMLRRWAEVSHRLVAISLGQSLVRLLCWCVQLGLVLWALSGGEISLLRGHVITNLFVYYLLVTITPNVPVAEVGVRGAWAIVVFGSMNAALAGVLLWIINTLLPCLIWPFLRKKKNIFA